MTRFALLQTVLTTPSPPCRDVWGIQVTLRAAHIDAVDVQELSSAGSCGRSLGDMDRSKLFGSTQPLRRMPTG